MNSVTLNTIALISILMLPILLTSQYVVALVGLSVGLPETDSKIQRTGPVGSHFPVRFQHFCRCQCIGMGGPQGATSH